MKKIRLEIKRKNKKYPIFIGKSAFKLIKKFLKENHADKKIVIITEKRVKKLCASSLKFLKPFNPYLITIPAGEKSKTRETKQKVEDIMLKEKYGRDTVIIAFGGGVIGDLAGFIASTFCRGIPFIQVPTTLLAMVDSSIGGKTGVDTKYGKNLIGTFYQPDAVFADLNFLSTLPHDEFLNGLAEAIKVAITSDKNLFSFIEKNKKNILAKENNILLPLIKRSIELKKYVVVKDEKESGLRQILNFGHTFGHAFETYSKYKIKHGYCISLGIAVEARISAQINNLKNKEVTRIFSLLKSFGLPTKLEKQVLTNKIIKLMEIDKKSNKLHPKFVIIQEIGKIKTHNSNFSFTVNQSIIKKSIEASK